MMRMMLTRMLVVKTMLVVMSTKRMIMMMRGATVVNWLNIGRCRCWRDMARMWRPLLGFMKGLNRWESDRFNLY